MDYHLGYDTWLKWKKDVVLSVSKIANQYQKKPFRIMDFSVYHRLTAEKVPTGKNTEITYYLDVSHYKNKLGLIFLDRLVGNNQHKDFGVELNLTNIDSHLVPQKMERLKYIDTKKHQLKTGSLF